MSDGIVQLQADSTGKKVDTSELTVGANLVERQRIVFADDAVAAALAKVQNASPGASDYGVTTRPIPPAITKGAQGANGYSTQDLKDSGRTHVNYYAMGVAAGASSVETAITLTKSGGTAATATNTSFVITSGKRFRITSITVASRGNNTSTQQVTTFSIRMNATGAVVGGVTPSTPLLLSTRTMTPATANAVDRIILPLPDGFEIVGDGALQFGVTANAVYSTNAPTWDVLITGFEY